MAELIVTSGDGRVQRYQLGRQTIIGRLPDCDVVLTDPMSSRRHCHIGQIAGGGFFVEDLGSANGTFHNSQPLRSRQPFLPTDTVQIGTTRLNLLVGAAAPAQEQAFSGGAAAFDPNLSIVRLREDQADQAPSIDYAVAAGGEVVTAEEQASSNLAQLKQVTKRLKLMLDIGQSVGLTLDARKVLHTCLDKLFEIFTQAERGFVLLYGPDGELPSAVNEVQDEGEGDKLKGRKGPLSVSKIRNPGQGDESEVQISRTVVNQVRSKRQSVLLSDTNQDPDFSPALSMARLEIRSVMCAPLIAAQQDLGILYLDTKDPQHRFCPEDLDVLTAVAGQIAVVIKNAELALAAAAESATRENLQRFLSPHLVDRIIAKEINFQLGGSKKIGTVFFSDIVGFTRIAAQMLPADVLTLLNRYFKVMQEIIFSRSGTVDKFNGDQIMAFWGVLVDVPAGEAAAGAAALEMQNAMFVLNRELAADQAVVKPPEPLGQGIGLNTGDFVAGNIGSERKIEYTVIGNAVNLAQRLESIAGRGQVFLGHGTYERIRERALAFRMPDCPVKNVAEPIQVYSLRGIIPPVSTGQASGSNATGQTSRLTPNSEEVTYSLPCFLNFENVRKQALVTRMMMSQGEKRALLQVLADTPYPIGTKLSLEWDLPEKPGLPPLHIVVERSWKLREDSTDFPLQPTREILTPMPTPGSHKVSTMIPGGLAGASPMAGLESSEGTLVLRALDLPDEILRFTAGQLIPSDLTSPEQIVRG